MIKLLRFYNETMERISSDEFYPSGQRMIVSHQPNHQCLIAIVPEAVSEVHRARQTIQFDSQGDEAAHSCQH